MTVPTPALGGALTALAAAVTTQVATLTATENGPVLVCVGPPTLEQPDDFITIGEQMDETYTAHAIVGDGAVGAFHEEFTVSVVIDVYRGGDTFATTAQRCATLAAAVHAAVRGDMSLGGTVYKAEPQSNRYEQLWEADSTGTRVRCETAIHCQAIN